MPNPFNPSGPVNPRYFAGRSAVIQELSNRLKSTIDGTPQHSAIMGERGIGKTSVLRKVQEIAHEKRCIVARVDLYPNIADLEHLLLLLHEELRNSCLTYYSALGKGFEAIRTFLENYSVALPVYGGGIQRMQQKSLETTFRGRLLEIWSKVQHRAAAVVLMVDEAEGLMQVAGALEYLRNTFSRLNEEDALYCLVISGKTNFFHVAAEIFSPLERFFRPITLNLLSEDEVIELLDRSTTGTGIIFDDDVKKDIFGISEGQPYVVQIFGYILFEYASSSGVKRIDRRQFRMAYDRVLQMLETQIFDRRFTEGVGQSKHKLQILKKLAQHKNHSYSFSEIERIAKVLKKQGLGVYLTQLVEAGCLQKNASTGRYSFFMNIFKEFVAKKTESVEAGVGK